MGFNIDSESKNQILVERIQQFNIEGYQHELNLKTAILCNNAEGIAQAEQAIAIIEAAILVYEEELANG